MMDSKAEEEINKKSVSENQQKAILETREEMMCRHRKEIGQLQKKEIEMKKAAARGSKAEQKAKKKQVEEEILMLTAKLKENQAEELAAWSHSDGHGSDKDQLDSVASAASRISLTYKTEQSGPTKSAKRRSKRAQQEFEREQRIQEEKNSTVSDRMIEDEKLENKLEPLGLAINEVKPDGHCLYRAVEDQLALLSGGSSPYTYLELRQMVAAYMRKNAADFLPFFLSENIGDSNGSIEERYESYCQDVESTSAWGGQLELEALTHCLQKHITIFSGFFPDVEMGKEYRSQSDSSSSKSSILLSYHKHAFGLGEHYNSVVPYVSL